MDLRCKHYFLILLLAFLFCGNIKSAYADILGDRIKPFFAIREVYDSNIFRVKDKEQLRGLIGDDKLSDFVTILTGGMNLNYQISRQEVDILLRKDFLRCSHYISQDSEQDEVNGSISLRVLERISAKLRGSYTKVPEARENYRTQQKNERTTKGSGLSIGYNLPSGFSIQAGFRQEKEDFSLLEFRFRERTNRYYSGTLSYSPSPESKFYTVYQRNALDYDLLQPIGGALVNNDSTGDVIKVGVDRKFSPKTSLSFYAGYLWRKHEEFKARDFHGVIGKAQVYYGITEKLTLSIIAERELYEEIFLDQIYSVNESLGLGSIYKPTAKIEVFVYGSTSKKSYKGDANIIAIAFPERKDRLNEFKTGIAWSPIRRLSMDLLYRYTARNSNFDIYDYKAHEIESGMSYKF